MGNTHVDSGGSDSEVTMPYEKVSTGKGKYNVRNKETGKVHARGTTGAKADAQMRLLRGAEHGMVPRTTRQASGIDKERQAGPKTHKTSKGGRR